jgi:hypothetical protein
MRLLLVLALLVTAMLPALSAPVRPAVRSTKSAAVKKKRGSKASVRRVLVRRKVHGRWVTVSRLERVNTGPVIPTRPEPDRLREIQKALADKGYFKGEVNGVWNADSAAAMKQFQTESKLTADGKINALSLTGLGLGPKHDGNVAAVPVVKPDAPTPPQ